MIAAILATGPSMSQVVADSVKGKCLVVAVNNAYALAPWADALVATDFAWWKHHTKAHEFKGRKFTTAAVEGTERVPCEGAIVTATNSGLLGCHVAVKYLGATKLLLLGFDMNGTHYFGEHPTHIQGARTGLKNTAPERFEGFKRQFKHWSHKGITVYNCTSGSALDCFPMATLEESLA